MDMFHLILVWVGYAAGVAVLCWGAFSLYSIPHPDDLTGEFENSGGDDAPYIANILAAVVTNVATGYLFLGGIVILLLSAILHRMIT